MLRLNDFQRIYPLLWRAINIARVDSGSNRLDKEYDDSISIPIKMSDAMLADNFLAKNEKSSAKKLGYSELNKIIDIVKSEPDIFKWSDILYSSSNKTINKQKKVNKMPHNNIVTGEIIAIVDKVDNGFKAYDSTSGEELTTQINNQKKLKYAFNNKGCIRGRQSGTSTVIWRVVKERFVREPMAPWKSDV